MSHLVGAYVGKGIFLAEVTQHRFERRRMLSCPRDLTKHGGGGEGVRDRSLAKHGKGVEAAT
jgi:hypothetical protein